MQVDVTAEVRLDDLYTDDGESRMLHLIAQKAASRVREELGETLRYAIQQQVQAEITAVITEVMNQPIKRTDRWGAPLEGNETTLREIIYEEARAWFKDEVRDGSYSDRWVPRMVKVAKEVAAGELEQYKRELKAEVDAQLKARLTETVQEAVIATFGKRL